MTAALRIAAKDLKVRIRDRSVFILGILAPLALAFIFNLIFGDAGDQDLALSYGLVDLDNTELSESLGQVLASIEAEGILQVAEYQSEEEAAQAAESGEIGAYFLLKPGLGEAALSASPYTIGVVAHVDRPISTQIATAIAEQFGSGIGLAQLSVATAVGMLDEPPPADVVLWGEEAATASPVYVLTDRSADTRQLDPTTFFAAGMAVFFVFFTAQFGVIGLLEEEHDGTLSRLLAAPISRISVVTGKAVLSFGLGVISMGVLIAATSFLMGANWGNPVGVGILVTAVALSAVGVISLVASTAKSPEGAGNLGATIAVILGMLGGTFFPLGQGEDLLSRLTLITPHAWFMRGLAEVSGDAAWTAALPATVALLVFASLTGAVGWFLLRRRLAR